MKETSQSEDMKIPEDFILKEEAKIIVAPEAYNYDFSKSVKITVLYRQDINKYYRRGGWNPKVVLVERSNNEILSIPMSDVCPSQKCTGGSTEKHIENLISTQSLKITYKVCKLDDYGLYLNWRPIITVYTDGREVLNKDFSVGNTNAAVQTHEITINIRKK